MAKAGRRAIITTMTGAGRLPAAGLVTHGRAETHGVGQGGDGATI